MVRWKVLLGVGVIFLMASSTWSGLGTMSVQVRDGQLRATPLSWGQSWVRLPMGIAWRSNSSRATGWKSPAKVKGLGAQFGPDHEEHYYGGGGRDAQMKASGKEVALAGKGFNAEVEAQYRKGHRNVNYPAVDRMELVQISPQEMATFLEQGAVKPASGGAQ